MYLIHRYSLVLLLEADEGGQVGLGGLEGVGVASDGVSLAHAGDGGPESPLDGCDVVPIRRHPPLLQRAQHVDGVEPENGAFVPRVQTRPKLDSRVDRGVPEASTEILPVPAEDGGGEELGADDDSEFQPQLLHRRQQLSALLASQTAALERIRIPNDSDGCNYGVHNPVCGLVRLSHFDTLQVTILPADESEAGEGSLVGLQSVASQMGQHSLRPRLVTPERALPGAVEECRLYFESGDQNDLPGTPGSRRDIERSEPRGRSEDLLLTRSDILQNKD